MKIHLVRQHKWDIELGPTFTLRQSINCQIELTDIEISSSQSYNKSLLDNLEKHLKEKFGLDKECTISLELISSKTCCPSSSKAFSKNKGFSLQGDLLNELHRFFYGNNKNKLLQIEVNAECFQQQTVRQRLETGSSRNPITVPAVNRPQLYGWIKAKAFTPRVDAAGNIDHAVYVQRAVELPPLPIHTASTANRLSWSITINIWVSPKAFICLDSILPKAEDTAREIFETKKFPDFAIISEDGTRIPCHKVFLAKSPVLTQMFEGGFQEARTNEMTMGDMTTQGVNAFLEFLYCGEVNQAMTHCDIAFELLKAADMYDLPSLWNAMTSILSAKSHTWYKVDVALRLFVFVKNCARDEIKSLIKKMIKVVGLKPEQLSRSTAFKELFPSQASQDMFLTALTSSHP